MWVWFPLIRLKLRSLWLFDSKSSQVFAIVADNNRRGVFDATYIQKYTIQCSTAVGDNIWQYLTMSCIIIGVALPFTRYCQRVKITWWCMWDVQHPWGLGIDIHNNQRRHLYCREFYGSWQWVCAVWVRIQQSTTSITQSTKAYIVMGAPLQAA